MIMCYHSHILIGVRGPWRTRSDDARLLLSFGSFDSPLSSAIVEKLIQRCKKVLSFMVVCLLVRSAAKILRQG